MATPNTTQPDTLADVKDEAKPFNEKLKRVLKDKPAKELADLLDVKVSTIYQWKTRGYQPAAHQLPIVAEFAGCSLDYLCDNRIDVDADPTSGAKFAKPLSEMRLTQVLEHVAERYVGDAVALLTAIKQIEQTDWRSIAEALVEKDLGGIGEDQFQTIATAFRAKEVSLRAMGYDPSLPVWVAPHLSKHPGVSVEDLDYYMLRRRWFRAMTELVKLIVDYSTAYSKSREDRAAMRGKIKALLEEKDK